MKKIKAQIFPRVCAYGLWAQMLLFRRNQKWMQCIFNRQPTSLLCIARVESERRACCRSVRKERRRVFSWLCAAGCCIMQYVLWEVANDLGLVLHDRWTESRDGPYLRTLVIILNHAATLSRSIHHLSALLLQPPPHPLPLSRSLTGAFLSLSPVYTIKR